MQDDKLTLSQAAKLVDLSASYLRTLCQKGELPAEQIIIGSRCIWRVERSDLLAWKAQRGNVKQGRKPKHLAG